MGNHLIAKSALVLALTPLAPIAAQTVADRSAVLHVVGLQYSLFQERKATEYGNLFTEDGTFVSLAGLKIDGRRDIIKANAQFFAIIDVARTKMTFKPPRIKFVDRQTAIAYSPWGGLWTRGDKTAQSGYLTMVLRKGKSGWKINSATNAGNIMGAADYDLVDYSASDPRWNGKAQ